MRKYIKIWIKLAKLNFETQYGSGSRLNTIFLILGKLVRLGFFLAFLITLVSHTKTLAGFSLYQVLLFFMTFNLIDISVQFFLRGIYQTRSLVVEGQFDGILLKPINPLFRIASHNIDFLDLLTILPVVGILVYVILHLPGAVGLGQILLYLFMIMIGFLIALAIHIIVASLAVATQELDNEIWIYRDLMSMGRFPVDIYALPIQVLITFVVPVALMVSYPAKAMLGILSLQSILTSVLVAAFFLFISLKVWKWSLKKYSGIGS